MDDFKPSTPPSTDDADSSLSKPAGGQVMDIQTPKSFSVGDSAPVLPGSSEEQQSANTGDDAVAEAPTAPETAAESNEGSPETDNVASTDEVLNATETVAEPISDTSAADPALNSINVATMDGIKPSEQAAPLSAETPVSSAAETSPLAIPPTPTISKKSGKPTLVIVVALIVAIGLAGLVIFTFMKNKKDTVGSTDKSTSNATSTQTATKPLASPADVDNTNKEIETSLNKVNDSTDFSSADLSDKSLGL